MTLGPRHFEAFSRVADTIVPSAAGSDLGRDLPDLYRRLPHQQDQTELRQFLGLLHNAAGGLLLYGRPRAYTSMSPEQQASAYRVMEGHPLSRVRKGARALKTLAAFLWVTTDDAEIRPPPWDVMGYPGPDGPAPEVAKEISITTIDRDTTLETDVVVVGSGAGGGTAAGVLAGAGLDVVVLEAGEYRNESDFSHLEAHAYADMYLQGALGSTADGGVAILAGATLGGGTVINYTTSFPTPDALRQEWDQISGLDGVFTGDRYQSSSDAVQERYRVNRGNGWPSPRDQLLEKGLRQLGWHADEMPRNAEGCNESDCGYCTMGCRIGAKRSALSTYLQDAATAGTRFVTGASVRTVTVDSGRVTGVVADVDGHELQVRAKAVVLAAGALNTPAILLRSGLGGRAVGRFLRLHPVTAVWGRFEERVDPWTGVLQRRYSDQFADLDGGYGFKFETAPVHPLFPAAFIGWNDGESFQRDILGLGHLGVAGILLRDRDQGRVTIRKDGSPVWRYKISKYDQGHIKEGVRRGAELLAAAGATEVIASAIKPVRWRPGAEDLITFIEAVNAVGYGPNRMSYFSFHQMGSARMGSDPAASVVGADNQTHDTAGLYVMDGSCFPNASGVNPMISIATIAHRGATLLAEQLG